MLADGWGYSQTYLVVDLKCVCLLDVIARLMIYQQG